MPEVLTITVPGRVYYDYLDPGATAVQSELGLPLPTFIKRGRGSSAIYTDIPLDVAAETAYHLQSRADLLLGQDADEMAHVHYAARKAAERIAAQIRRGTQ
jgi:hypothetical protein